MSQIQQLVSTTENVMNGEPWYGNSVMKTIESIDFRMANNKLSETSHSIAEILSHMTNWKRFAIEKINGSAFYDIAIDSDTDWPSLSISTLNEWNGLVKKFVNTHNEFMKTLENLSGPSLDQKIKGRNYNVQYLIEGIVQHDIYHLGQISLLQKLTVKLKNQSPLL